MKLLDVEHPNASIAMSVQSVGGYRGGGAISVAPRRKRGAEVE